MSDPILPGLPTDRKTVFGMLHLPALPGAPGFAGDIETVRHVVLRDAELLLEGGVDGLVMENFHDTPFYPDRVPAGVVAHMTHIAAMVRARYDVPLGINVLRNDGLSALAIAHAVDAAFIRVNILTSARVADQGIIQGIAHELLRERKVLDAEHIKIFADVNVKHSVALGRPQALEDEVHDLASRGGADAIIVTGRGTGLPTDSEDAQRVRSASCGKPVLIGSGVSADTIHEFTPHVDGFIIGTYFKTDGAVDKPVDVDRVRRLLDRLK